MSNALGVYNPVFYANEALIHLEKALGMAARVHRGYEQERLAHQMGDIINIRRPSTFTAQAAPSSAQDLATETVSIGLNNWQEVKFALTDQELAYTEKNGGQVRIINDHIRPAAYALADKIDQDGNALYADIPWYADAQGSPSLLDLTGPYQALFDNQVPMSEGMLHLEVNGAQQGLFQQLPAFHDASVRGVGLTETLRRGSLGVTMGLEVFANQNVRTHTKGTLSDPTPALVGAHAKGATSVTMDDTTLTGTLQKGDTFVLAGNSQRYAVTANATAGGNAITASITPALVQAYDDNAAVTVNLDNHVAMLAFHRNAFAFASAPLPDTIPAQLGAQVATVTDPNTGLSIRSRMFYLGDSSKVVVALDVLYGWKTLDPNLAARLRG